jgi:recombination protein RecT
MAKGKKAADKPQGNGQGREIVKVKERVGEVRQMLTQNEPEIRKALGKLLDPVQFVRICMTTYQRGGEAMMKADPRSFVAACVEAAQLGLKPDTILGECYLIPRWSKDANCTLVNFQLGYRGLIKIARRGGEVSDIAAEVVYENDRFEVRLGTERKIIHVPWYSCGAKEPGDVIAAYATAKLADESIAFKVMPKHEIDAAAERSGNPKDKKWSNVWLSHYGPMACKTAATRLCKWLPMPDESKRAIGRDEQREEGILDDDMRNVIDVVTTQPQQPPEAPQTLDDLVPGGGQPDEPPHPADGAPAQ